jgi:hypothetical protein
MFHPAGPRIILVMLPGSPAQGQAPLIPEDRGGAGSALINREYARLNGDRLPAI